MKNACLFFAQGSRQLANYKFVRSFESEMRTKAIAPGWHARGAQKQVNFVPIKSVHRQFSAFNFNFFIFHLNKRPTILKRFTKDRIHNEMALIMRVGTNYALKRIYVHTYV